MYKGKYEIGVYNIIDENNDNDEMVGLFDSVQEFADFFGKSLKKAYDILGIHFVGKTKNIYFDGKTYELAFIDMEEEI